METMIDFFMDPLRLTLIIAGVVVILAIIIFGRRSTSNRDIPYSSSGTKEFSFGGRMNEETFTEEEVVVLPPRKKEKDLIANDADTRIPVNLDDEIYAPQHTEAFGPTTVSNIKVEEDVNSIFGDEMKPEIVESKQATKKTESIAMKQDVKTSVDSSERDSEQSVKKVAMPDTKEETVTNNKVTHKERFVVLYIIAAEGKPFTGKEILGCAQTLGLAFGKHSVFHYPIASAETGQSKYCLVNMTSEGCFPAAELPGFETNGVSLIMRLPIANADGLTVFSNMLGAAQALARKLGGEILDQTRMPLTADIVTSLRSDIAHFESEVKQQSAVPEL